MKNSTYKWIIGCLIGVIIILITYLVVKENGIISVSFSECLSVAATLSSLILSVVAMFYTFFSGRDTKDISDQIRNTITEINEQVRQVSEDTKKNLVIVSKIKEGMHDIESALHTSTEALDTIKQENISEKDKQSAIENIQKTKNSMMMFLNKMNESK